MTLRQIALLLGILTLLGCKNNNSQTRMNDLDNLTTEKTKIEYQLDITTTKDLIGQVIDNLDERCAINFFDNFHPQISDPGAYVTVHKENGQLKYELANHGWSSEWKEISKDSLTDYIYKNREYNGGKLVLAARHKKNVEVKEKDIIVITPMYYKIDDKKEK